MSHRILATLTLAAGLLAGSPASAQGNFHYWTAVGGWPGTYMSASANWSSDLGVDYVYRSDVVNGGMAWDGPGRTWGTADGDTVLSGETLGWEVDQRGGAAGLSYSGGEFSAAPATALTGGAVAVSRLHLWSVLGVNDPGYGIDTNGYLVSYLVADSGGQAYAPLHYRIDWQIAATTVGTAASTWLSFSQDFSRNLIPLNGSAGSATGVLDGYWYDGQTQFGVLEVFNGLAETGAWGGTGRVDLWATISLSREAIAAVPEPTQGLLLGTGLLVLALRRR